MIQRGAHIGLLAAALAFFTVTSFFFLRFTADDAYIVARYAVNARDVGEWTFNRGEHISAMTSPLHGILLVGLSFLAADPLPLYKAMAVVLVVASFLWLIVRYGVHRREATLFAAVLVAPSFILWMSAGLETPLLAAIVTAMAVVSYLQPSGKRSLFTLALLTGLAVVTRYDAVLSAGPLFLSAIARAYAKKPDVSVRVLLAAVAVAAVAPALWLLYSWRQFGAVLPTSFYIKTPSGAFDVIAVNTRYIVEHLAISGIGVLVVYVAVRLVSSGAPLQLLAAEVRARWGLHLGLAAVLIYGSSMATVHMMFAFRHFMPYLPATALALALLARRVDESTREPQRVVLPRWVEPVAVAMILTVHALHAEALFHRSLQGLGTQGEYAAQGMAGYARDFIPAMRRNAEDVRAHWDSLKVQRPPRIWTFAAGALPYAYREAYIFEELVSFRHRCPTSARDDPPDSRGWRAHADYIHAFTRHGSLTRLLSPMRAGQVQVISKQPIHFNGRDEMLLVYYNATPRPNELPGHIDEPCVRSVPDGD
jgi:hypothetical protein